MNQNAVYDEWSDWYSCIYGTYDQGVDYFRDTVGRALLGYIPSGLVMDAGCGIGMSSGGLLKSGFSVTGIDLSPASVNRCRELLTTYGNRASFVRADLLDLPRNLGKFDAATALTAIIHHFLSRTSQKRFLRAMWNSLPADGILLMSVSDYDARYAQDPDNYFSRPLVLQDVHGKEFIYFKRRMWNGTPRKSVHRCMYYRINDNDTTQCIEISLCAILQPEIDALLTCCGFATVDWLYPAQTGFHKKICIARKVHM